MQENKYGRIYIQNNFIHSNTFSKTLENYYDLSVHTIK